MNGLFCFIALFSCSKIAGKVQFSLNTDESLTLFRLGFLRVAQLGKGGGGRKVSAACNSKTVNDNEMKFGGVVKDHLLINLV